ncbi:MAG TPA: proton-conducting transporter membrane subunit [Longimicrobiales bacterium]|nr:proton-conducting transporter membrane subunit [Longimicrobiales bacterium]
MVTPLVDSALLPLLILVASLGTGLTVLLLPRERLTLAGTVSAAGAAVHLVLVAVLLQGVAAGARYEWALEVMPGLSLTLVGDALALLFLTLSAVLWLATTVYAVGYMKGTRSPRRFFAFLALCITATTGIALAGDLFTFVVFYEALTWATYPLVVHEGSEAALRAGRKYLRYTLTAGAVLIVGAVWFQTEVGTLAFRAGGVVDAAAATAEPGRYLLLFVLLIAGVGVKSAFVPLHGWLPSAMVAPTPVSALLHAVAVVKAGAFGVVRVLHSLFGIDVATQIGAAALVAALAAFTILYGSIRALWQDEIKRLLAFSTISQLSYIALGVAFAHPLLLIGGLAHLVHQGLMKITLFFCAGVLSEELGITRVSQMAGVGRRLPWTMVAFSVGALGMIGLPPIAGFFTKWYMGVGAIQAGSGWIVLVLLASTGLNAAYFLPVLKTAWIDRPPEAASEDAADPAAPAPSAAPATERVAADRRMLIPTVATAALALAAGLLAGSAWSPIGWVELIVSRGLM